MSSGLFHAYIPVGYMPYLSNSAQKRSPKQKRLLFWYKLVAAMGTEILVAFSRYRSRPGDNLIRFAGVVWVYGARGLGPGARLSDLEQWSRSWQCPSWRLGPGPPSRTEPGGLTVSGQVARACSLRPWPGSAVLARLGSEP